MNEEIKYLYEGLDEICKMNIRSVFEQSPKMLLYIDLLEQNEIVITNKAVNYIYQEDLEAVARNVLINRFYKLRSKLRLWLLTQMKNSPVCLTTEEQELAFLRLMVIKNEHAYALEQLQLLEKKCWEQNLFELLPEIIQLILRSMYACKAQDKAEHQFYLAQLELANSLHAVLQSLKYNLCFLRQNIKEYQNIIEVTCRKIKKLKQYPRLTMLYHFMAFSAGVFLEDIVQKTSNAMSRHLNEFKLLKDKFPNIPIDDFEPFHRAKMDIHFCMKEALFWYYKQNPKKSYEAIERRKRLVEENPDLHLKLSEAELHNVIYFCINAEQYRTALDYIEELKEYQSNNPYDKIDSPYYTLLMVVYIALFPTQKIDAPQELIAQIKTFLKTSDQGAAWIYGSLAEFCILYGYFDEAKEILKSPALKQLFEENGIPMQTDKLLEVVLTKNIGELKKFIQHLSDLHLHSTSPKHQFHYKGILKIADYFLKIYSTRK